jgi:GDP/UDP-N,N'-diacetylbacillosamine 2-epimerase (hydrolysing)
MERRFFIEKFNIPEQDFALVTFHPETLFSSENIAFAHEIRKGLTKIISKLFLVITMPNADALGSIFRNEIERLKNTFPNQVLCVENFGKENYFNAMYHSKLLIGNTSSGILEAATFSKYVINVGDRQKGRLQSSNVLNAKFDSDDMFEKTMTALNMGEYCHGNLYEKSGTAKKIITVIKKYYDKARKF